MPRIYRAAWVRNGAIGGYTFAAADHQLANQFAYSVLEPILKSSAGAKGLVEILTVKEVPSRFPQEVLQPQLELL